MIKLQGTISYFLLLERAFDTYNYSVQHTDGSIHLAYFEDGYFLKYILANYGLLRYRLAYFIFFGALQRNGKDGHNYEKI